MGAKVKKKRETGIMIIIIRLVSSEGNSWVAKPKPKLEELLIIFSRLFENSYAVDTHQKI